MWPDDLFNDRRVVADHDGSRRSHRALTQRIFEGSRKRTAESSSFKHTLSSKARDDLTEGPARGTIDRLSSMQFSLEELVAKTQSIQPDVFENAKAKMPETVPLSLEAIEVEFKTDRHIGLSETQAALNQSQYGSNVIPEPPPPSLFGLFLDEILSPLALLLTAGLIVSALVQEWVEAIVVACLLVINAVSSSLLQKQAHNALRMLASLSPPTCKVIRANELKQVPVEDVVGGDLVIIETGSTIPADLRLVTASDLTVNESLLTGEFLEVLKHADQVGNNNSFPSTMCFHSTLVTGGSGKGLVVAVGMDTQLGMIASQLAAEAAKGNKKTPLEVTLDRLGGTIGACVLVVLIVTMVTAWVTHYEDPTRPHRSRLVTLLVFGVGFAVSAMPESLPLVVTSCFAIGCQTLNRLNARVRRLPAVETLGCTSVICTDKTGTLTRHEVTAKILSLPVQKRGADEVWCIEAVLEGNEDFETAGDIGTIHLGRSASPNLAHDSDLPGLLARSALMVARLASAQCVPICEDGRWTLQGNQTDIAVVTAAAVARWSELPGHWNIRNVYKSDESLNIPFSASRKLEIFVYPLFERSKLWAIDLPDNIAAFATVKGAPEIFESWAQKVLCASSEAERLCIGPMRSDLRTEVTQKNLHYAGNGYRVIGLGLILLTSTQYRYLQKQILVDDRFEYLKALPCVWLGLIAFNNPPRERVMDAVTAAKDAHIRVVVITGDQMPNAFALSKKLKICDTEDEVSSECIELVERYGESQVDREFRIDMCVSRTAVFCRARPADKMEIIKSLQRQGHVVAMSGDGVNDGPALQMADIGIAMGQTGTEVAKAASDLVLLDDDFSTIVVAVHEGRRIFDNVQKFVAFLIGTDFGEMAYLCLSVLCGLKLPVDAFQLLFINLACDVPPAVSLAKEPAEEALMSLPPRKRHDSILPRKLWIFVILPQVVLVGTTVLLGTMLASYLNSGVITNKQIVSQCRVDEVFKHQYMCQTQRFHIRGLYANWVTDIDFVHDGEIRQYFGVIDGWHSKQFLTPEEIGINRDSLRCDHRDDLGWCLPDENTYYPPRYSFVNLRNAKQANTQTFILASLSEIIWPYSLRSYQPIHKVFNRSGWLHMGVCIPASLVYILVVLPLVRRAFSLSPVLLWQLTWPTLVVLLVVLIGEVGPKRIYRHRHPLNQKIIEQ